MDTHKLLDGSGTWYYSMQMQDFSSGDRALSVLALAAHTVVPGLALSGRGDVTGADDEVTEVLAFLPLKGVVLDHRPEDSEDLRLRDRF